MGGESREIERRSIVCEPGIKGQMYFFSFADKSIDVLEKIRESEKKRERENVIDKINTALDQKFGRLILIFILLFVYL